MHWDGARNHEAMPNQQVQATFYSAPNLRRTTPPIPPTHRPVPKPSIPPPTQPQVPNLADYPCLPRLTNRE